MRPNGYNMRFMSNKLLLLLVASTGIVCSAYLLHNNHAADQRKNKEAVLSSVATRLPLGSSRVATVDFLKSNNLEYSVQGKQVYAIVRGTSKSWMFQTDVQLKFTFSNEGKLVNYEAKKFTTGL